ncbi:hypothetical protein MSAN_02087400 [Mycena sanguinolenta]|uniref:Uncharacterized protein n=1 Tax=Mycena sanguinolenta TaxID=230812 RepID=A0A8H6XIB4_9AGAR|nr:hypothetical protein MSAN_02087400 [Mycena sanguinolenta]
MYQTTLSCPPCWLSFVEEADLGPGGHWFFVQDVSEALGLALELFIISVLTITFGPVGAVCWLKIIEATWTPVKLFLLFCGTLSYVVLIWVACELFLLRHNRSSSE